MVHISGFGQTGPLAGQAGFGSVGEAMGGIRFTTGSPDRPPAAGRHQPGRRPRRAVRRDRHAGRPGRAPGRPGKGQEVDVAIYEAVAALMESTMADYELGGVRAVPHRFACCPGWPRRTSTRPPTAPRWSSPPTPTAVFVPACAGPWASRRWRPIRGTPPTAPGATNSDGARRHRSGRGRAGFRATAVLALLDEHGVPAGRIFTAPDMLTDPQYLARDMVPPGHHRPRAGTCPMTAASSPASLGTPGSIRFPGPALGQHTDEVLRELLGDDDGCYGVTRNQRSSKAMLSKKGHTVDHPGRRRGGGSRRSLLSYATPSLATP